METKGICVSFNHDLRTPGHNQSPIAIASPAVYTMGAFVSRFLGQASPTRAPPIDPTDEILPVHPFDSNPVLRECMLFWTFRFDDVLDADMLGHGLSQLLQMEGWRRLGGRFRRNVCGLFPLFPFANGLLMDRDPVG
jgi:hypothetical protein